MDGSSTGASAREPFPVRYSKFLHRWKYAAVVVWAVITLVLGYFAMGFVNKTSQAFNAMPGTDSHDAVDEMTNHFPTLGTATNIVVYLESLNGQSIVENPTVEAFDRFLEASLKAKYDPSFLSMYESYWTLSNATRSPAQALTNFVSSDNMTTFLVVTVSTMSTTKASTDAADYVQDLLDQWSFPHTRTTCLGLPSFITTIVSSTETNLGTVDAVSIPMAMLVLMWILQSPRLLVLPLLNMGVTAGCAFGAMSLVASVMTVNSVAPSLMMSILVAMSIDYNLFLLTRYREELIKLREKDETEVLPGLPAYRLGVISTMIKTAGETISVSAITLCLCFLGLLIFPMDFIQSIGVANSITILVTLMINITVTPCLLLLFPSFFEKCTRPFTWCGLCPGKAVAEEDEGLVDSTDAANLQGDDSEEVPQKEKSFWWRLATFCMSFPNNLCITIVILILTVPFDYFAFGGAKTDAMDLFLPRGAGVTNAYLDLADRFGLGKIYPIQALLVLHEEAPYRNVDNAQFYEKAGQFAQQLTEQVPHVNPGSIQGPVFGGGRVIPHQLVTACDAVLILTQKCSNLSAFFPSIIDPILEERFGTDEEQVCNGCYGLNFTHNMFLSPDRRALYMEIMPDADPLGKEGGDIYTALKSVRDEFQDSMHANVYYAGYNAITWDNIWFIFSKFGLMILVEILLVFAVLTFVFKSLIIPLRAAGTIMLTIAWTFGFADLVYEHKMLQWTGIEAFHSAGAVEWTNPVVLFSMIVGIGLDYDIFLLTRIKEYYDKAVAEGATEEPKTTLVAIHRGLCDTGHIITAAGMIMGVAFSGLFFSNIPVINEMGFYLVFSVLFDTFVVRSVLVPAIMSLLGEYNWWPGPLFRKCSSTGGYSQVATLDGIKEGV